MFLGESFFWWLRNASVVALEKPQKLFWANRLRNIFAAGGGYWRVREGKREPLRGSKRREGRATEKETKLARCNQREMMRKEVVRERRKREEKFEKGVR